MKNGTWVSLAASAGLPLLCPLAQTAAQVNSLRGWGDEAPSSGTYRFASSGQRYSIAILASSDPSLDSTLVGWGTVENYGGPLTGGCTNCPAPPAAGTKVKAIAAGRSHMAAILQDDTVYCWGDNSGTSITAPPGVKFKAISAGEGFTAGIVLDPNNEANDGTMRIWGANYDFTSSCGVVPLLPYPAPSGKFLAIAAGGHHLIAIKADDRSLWRVGGTCGVYSQWYAGSIPFGQFRAISAGHTHSLAMKYAPSDPSDWTLVRWDGDANWRVNTDPLSTTDKFTAIASGYRYNIALRGNGTIATWGCMDGGGTCTGFPTIPDPGAGLEYGKISAGYYGAIGTVNCYGNCDGSAVEPIYNVLDYNCFTNRFSAGDPWANCDGSTIPPVLNVLDFMCFNNMFVACSPH